METIQNTLQKFGFELSTAEIYVILANNGELTVPQILQKTSLSRASVYDSLSQLLAGEYLEYRKEGRNAFYKLVHPDKLFGLLEEKKRETELLGEEMNSVIRTLTGSFNLSNNKPGVRFFEGEEGIKEVIFDSLKAKEEILTFLDVDATQKYLAETNKEYVKKRVELNIKKRQIVPDTPATRERYKNYSPLLEVRFLPANIKPFQTSVQIYNNSVSFATLDDKKKIGVLIEDEQITQFHRSIFELVWQMLTLKNNSVTPPQPILPSEL